MKPQLSLKSNSFNQAAVNSKKYKSGQSTLNVDSSSDSDTTIKVKRIEKRSSILLTDADKEYTIAKLKHQVDQGKK